MIKRTHKISFIALIFVLITMLITLAACESNTNKKRPNNRHEDSSVTEDIYSSAASSEGTSSEETSSDVFVHVESVSFVNKTVQVKVGTMMPLEVKVRPTNATNPSYTLRSTNEDVVKISLNNIIAVGVGKCKVIATYDLDDSVTASCEIIVKANSDPSHKCTFIKTEVIDATCTEQGYSVYTCFCGETENKEYIDSLGHIESEWKTINEATESSEGLKRKSCTRCGETLKEEKIPKIEGTHTCSLKKSETVAATCTADGYSVYSCSCGKTEKKDYVSKLGHNESDWKVEIEATTTTNGLKRKSCTRCGVTLDEEIIPMVPNTEDPDAKYNVPDTMDNVKLLEERTLYYLNQYRLQDGVQEATALLNGKTYKYAKMRAEQLVDNFAHDMDDIREIATELEFGYYHPESPESYYDFEKDEVIYTGNMIPAYYNPGCSEAITKGYSNYSTVDGVAKEIAKACYNSEAHWSYVGAVTTMHITVGAYLNAGTHWYVCIATSGSDEYD